MEEDASVLARFGEHNYRAGHVVKVGGERSGHEGQVCVETYIEPTRTEWVEEKDCVQRPLEVFKELGLA